jgi:fumarylacetoacetase
MILDLRGPAIADLLDEAGARPDRSRCSTPGSRAGPPRGPRAAPLAPVRAAVDERYRDAVEPHLIGQSEVRMHVPCLIGDYTDFYVGIHHATNVGKQFRPDNPLLPNYKYVPIGYHGRASSVRASGEPVIRPNGQRKPPDADAPEYGPSRRLDYELELGMWIGRGNELGSSRSRSARRASISPAIACSTTGRRATCRRGNISRSGRSSPRIS